MKPARWTRAARLVASLTLANAALNLVVWAIRLPSAGGSGMLLLAVPGLLSGMLAWRGQAAGYAVALLFYGVQLAGFHPYAAPHAYPLRGAFSLAFAVQLPTGVLIVNAFAIALLVASAVLLWGAVEHRPGAKVCLIDRTDITGSH
jgi:hypothetical protein